MTTEVETVQVGGGSGGVGIASEGPAGTSSSAEAGGRPAVQAIPVVEQDAAQPASVPRLLSDKPPLSPFEGGDAPAGLGGTGGQDAEAGTAAGVSAFAVAEPAPPEGPVAQGGRSPRSSAQPAKSALKGGREGEAPGGNGTLEVAQSRALSWADTHGKDMHQVHEYQPSDHGSDGYRKNVGCSCCIQ